MIHFQRLLNMYENASGVTGVLSRPHQRRQLSENPPRITFLYLYFVTATRRASDSGASNQVKKMLVRLFGDICTRI